MHKVHSYQCLIQFTLGVIVVLVALLFINILNISYPVRLIQSASSTELAVVGEGTVEVIPDLAQVSVGVVVNNVSTPQEAQTRMSETHDKIVVAVGEIGVNKDDIATSGFSTYPWYGTDGQTISGYSGNTSISIKIRDISKVGEVISRATLAGANEVHSTQYMVENPGRYRNKARSKAIENGKQQAQQLSKDLGIKLGRVVNVVESNPTASSYQRSYGVGHEFGREASIDVQPGVHTVTSVITLYFEKR